VFDIDIRIQGLEQIRKVLLEAPEVAEAAIEDAATTLRNLVIGRTPVLTGVLKGSWSGVERTSTGFTFGTDKEYAVDLEEGLYPRVGPRTVELEGKIYSKQAPGGILAPLLEDKELLDNIIRKIAEELARSVTRAT